MTTMTFTYICLLNLPSYNNHDLHICLLNLPSYDNHDLHICLKFTFIWQPWPSHMSIKFTFLWQPWTSHTLYVSYIYLLMSIMTTMTFTYVCYLNLPSYDIHNHWRPKTMIYSTKPFIAHREWPDTFKSQTGWQFSRALYDSSIYLHMLLSHSHIAVQFTFIWQLWYCHIHIWLQFTFVWQLWYCHIHI
jgi:hypothetical protein